MTAIKDTVRYYRTITNVEIRDAGNCRDRSNKCMCVTIMDAINRVRYNAVGRRVKTRGRRQSQSRVDRLVGVEVTTIAVAMGMNLQ